MHRPESVCNTFECYTLPGQYLWQRKRPLLFVATISCCHNFKLKYSRTHVRSLRYPRQYKLRFQRYYSVHKESGNTLIMNVALVILTPDYQSAFYCALSRDLLWCRVITFLLRLTFLLLLSSRMISRNPSFNL